jgi:hypothetical protein
MKHAHKIILAWMVVGFMACLPAVTPTPTPDGRYPIKGTSQQ